MLSAWYDWRILLSICSLLICIVTISSPSPRPALWTAGRNAPGSFALFGANAWVHHSVFHLDDPRKATFAQNFVASIAGGVASITVAAPLDTIKVRAAYTTQAIRRWTCMCVGICVNVGAC